MVILDERNAIVVYAILVWH